MALPRQRAILNDLDRGEWASAGEKDYVGPMEVLSRLGWIDSEGEVMTPIS